MTLSSLDAALQLIQSHGLWILLPLAAIEGPIVTVIAAYLAQLGYMNVAAVYLVCVLGDLIGDSVLYAAGRYGPRWLPQRASRWMGITDAHRTALVDHFRTAGGRTLLFGKWTHSAGMPILVASGMARMNFARYLWFNLLGTIPKTLAFVLVGYSLGAAYASIDTYIYRGSQVLLVLAVLVGGLYLFRRTRRA